MDKKQYRIYNEILDKFKLRKKNKKITFVQYRNLNEFKYFEIERINPTHKINLYGVLKNGNKKKDCSKKFIEVGKILISFSYIFFYSDFIIHNFNFICLIFANYLIALVLLFIVVKYPIKELIAFDYWNRGILGRWKNHLHG